jgi:hypothetical protein
MTDVQRLSCLSGTIPFALPCCSARWSPPRRELKGYPGYPDTIMAPESAAGAHHRAAQSRKHKTATQHVNSTPAQSSRQVRVARGSSGSVPPTPLPRTPLIPPEDRNTLTVPSLPQEQGPTLLPGLNRSVPNLSHGPETFQDRASRCASQSGLYGVPGNQRGQYIGACVQ